MQTHGDDESETRDSAMPHGGWPQRSGSSPWAKVSTLPIFLDALLIAWTLIVSPFSQYGDVWAVYPPLILAAVVVLSHVGLVIYCKPRRLFLLYALAHLSLFFVLLIFCLFMLSKDSL